MTKEILLKLEDIKVHYGGVHALDGASVQIDEGEIVALMGPNGAGKSTILKAVFGLAPILSGDIFWHEKKIKPVSYKIAKMGISFVPQGRQLFHSLTVEENLEMGGVIVKDGTELERRIEEILEIFPELKKKMKEKSETLSGGQQQMLALARGIITDPKVLLLDEPTLGLSPKLVKEVFTKIKEINERHRTAIFVVEHNIKSLLEITSRAYVLDKGKVVAHGNSKEISKSDILEKVFLGKN